MKTNDLISLLVEDAPVRMRLGRMLALALVIGIVVSATLLLSTIGMRKNMMDAIETARVLFKIAITLALAVTASSLLFKVGRPDASLRLLGWALLIPLAALVIGILFEMNAVPEDNWRPDMMGHNAPFCMFFIPVLSLAPLAGFMLALKNGAPRNPGLAGAVAGLAAGGIAAAIYAWHCPDDSPLFVATWYSLAIAFVTLIGTLVGSRVLRW